MCNFQLLVNREENTHVLFKGYDGCSVKEQVCKFQEGFVRFLVNRNAQKLSIKFGVKCGQFFCDLLNHEVIMIFDLSDSRDFSSIMQIR